MYNIEYKTDVGDMAPDFTMDSTSGKKVRLYDCKNKKTVLLFFFDHQDRRCLDRLSSIARDYARFREKNVIVFPSTILPVAEGKKIVNDLGLPFAVLCDQDHTAARAYKVGQCSNETHHVCFEIISKVTDPQIMIIDSSGVIRVKHHLRGPGESPGNDELIKECEQALK